MQSNSDAWWKRMFFLFVLISIASGTATIVLMAQQPKIAYVNASSLMEGYNGMKESRQLLEQRKVAQQARLDSVAQVVDKLIANYQQNAQVLSTTDQQQSQALISRYQQEYFELKATQEEALASYENELAENVLAQLNGYIDQHGKDHGYDLIIGTSGEGNVLYAKQYYDITDELMVTLNNRYEGS